MKYGKLILEKCDFVMIKKFQQENKTYADYAHKNTLDILKKNMSKAIVLNHSNFPTDIVQMYSTITLTCNTSWQEKFQLVPPSKENIKKNKISVISTLGASIIGLSESDVLKYGLPGNIMSLKIEKVIQLQHRELIEISEEVFKKMLPKNYKKNITIGI